MPRLPQTDLEHVLAHTQGLWEDVRGQSVFVTGGTGFVGTWLLESLLHASDALDLRVRVVVLTRDVGRFGERSPHLARHPAVRAHAGNVVDFSFPEGRFPFVVHAATEQAFVPDGERPLGTFGPDVDGTRRVLEFARGHGARRLLLTSSGAVYGRQPSQMMHVAEDYAGAPSTTDERSAYGEAKRASELMCSTYGRACGFDAVIARLFAFVGPLLPLDANYAVGNFIGDGLAGRPIRITGDGTPYRSYLYAADLAIWLWTMLFRGKRAYPYNVGSSQELSIAELAQTVARVLDCGVGPEFATEPTPGAPASRYVPCVDRAATELGLRQRIPLAEGIRRTIEWHRQHDARSTRPVLHA